MANKTISVRVHVPFSEIENMLYSARQGTAYWAYHENEESTDNEQSGLELLEYENEVKDFMVGDLIIYVFDSEDDDKKHELDIKKVRRGLTCMAKKYPHHFKDVMDGNTDMVTADVLVQCALFNEIRYS